MNKLNAKVLLRCAIAGSLLLGGTAINAQVTDFNLSTDVQANSVNETPLFRGEQLFLAGSYAAASDVFQMADGLDKNEGIVGASRALAMMGNYQEAIRLCEEIIGDAPKSEFPLVSTQLAEVKRLIGRSQEALGILKEVVSDTFEPPVRTLVQYGSLLKFVGEREQASDVLYQAIDRYNNGLVFSSEDVAMVALASWLTNNFHDANSLFSEATRANPNNLEAHVLWGDLFLEKFNAVDAERSYQEALDINRRYAPALVGIAQVVGDERALQQALTINPNDVAALETYGQLALLNG